MILPVMAISNLVLTRQIYSEETNGAHAHYREPVPLKFRCVLRWLFLSVVFVTRVVNSHVNVTCFAAKHLKFDRRHSNWKSIRLSC